MRYFFIALVATSGFLFACTRDTDSVEIVGGIKDQINYKITKFESIDLPLDLNNDGVSNQDMYLEIPSFYFTNPNSDLELLFFKNESKILASFYLPTQNIIYDYNCCPEGSVEFYRTGFSKEYNDKLESVENTYKDNGVVSFNSLGDDKYQLVIERSYYDFKTKSRSKFTFLVEYKIFVLQ